MDEKKTIELLNQVVTISEETQYCMAVHEDFCSHSESWLQKHDPNCDRESGLIEAAKRAFEKDFEEAIKHLPEDTRDDLMDEFFDLDDMDYWWELREAVDLVDGDSK